MFVSVREILLNQLSLRIYIMKMFFETRKEARTFAAKVGKKVFDAKPAIFKKRWYVKAR